MEIKYGCRIRLFDKSTFCYHTYNTMCGCYMGINGETVHIMSMHFLKQLLTSLSCFMQLTAESSFMALYRWLRNSLSFFIRIKNCHLLLPRYSPFTASLFKSGHYHILAIHVEPSHGGRHYTKGWGGEGEEIWGESHKVTAPCYGEGDKHTRSF